RGSGTGRLPPHPPLSPHLSSRYALPSLGIPDRAQRTGRRGAQSETRGADARRTDGASGGGVGAAQARRGAGAEGAHATARGQTRNLDSEPVSGTEVRRNRADVELRSGHGEGSRASRAAATAGGLPAVGAHDRFETNGSRWRATSLSEDMAMNCEQI